MGAEQTKPFDWEAADMAISDALTWVEENAAALDGLQAGIAAELRGALGLGMGAIDAGEAAAERLADQDRALDDLAAGDEVG